MITNDPQQLEKQKKKLQATRRPRTGKQSLYFEYCLKIEQVNCRGTAHCAPQQARHGLRKFNFATIHSNFTYGVTFFMRLIPAPISDKNCAQPSRTEKAVSQRDTANAASRHKNGDVAKQTYNGI